METVQIYETTVLSPSSSHEAGFIIVPSRSYAKQQTPTWQGILEDLDFQEVVKVCPVDLGRALGVLLSPSVPSTEKVERLRSVPAGKDTEEACASLVGQHDLDFAARVVFHDPIPFEASPLTGETLVKLVTKASGSGLGAYVGFVTYGDNPLFLMLSVSMGMVICGAAKGVADALEDGLRERIKAWLKGERKRKKDQNSMKQN